VQGLRAAGRGAGQLLAAPVEGAAWVAAVCVAAVLQPADLDFEGTEDLQALDRPGGASSGASIALAASGDTVVKGTLAWAAAAAFGLAAFGLSAGGAGPWKQGGLPLHAAPLKAAQAEAQVAAAHSGAHFRTLALLQPWSAAAEAAAATDGAPGPATPATAEHLDAAAAQQLLLRWHAARQAALGQSHDASGLGDVMDGALLQAWRQQALQGSARGE
jgi:hypothetical protein